MCDGCGGDGPGTCETPATGFQISNPGEGQWLWDKDSGEGFLQRLDEIASEDAKGLTEAFKSYGPSWKKRGGIGAFMMLARKWDRLEVRLQKVGYDIFRGIASDERREGLIDDIRDLRRYLLLVEAEMRARGFNRTHRDNEPGRHGLAITGCISDKKFTEIG